jgi:hypothetical protein
MNSCLLQRRMEELPGVVVTTQRMITSRVAFLPETEGFPETGKPFLS